MAVLCDKVLKREVEFGEYPMSMTGEPTLTASYGTAKMLFRESQIK